MSQSTIYCLEKPYHNETEPDLKLQVKYWPFAPYEATIIDPASGQPVNSAASAASLSVIFVLGSLLVSIATFLRAYYRWRENRRFLKLWPIATFVIGTVVRCKGEMYSAKIGKGTRSSYVVTLDYCYTRPHTNQLVAVTESNMRDDLLGKALPRLGNPVAVVILKEPIHIAGKRRSEFVL